MKLEKIRAMIEKEEQVADTKIDKLIKKADALTRSLKEFKKLDREYRKIEFRLDQTAERRKTSLLKKGSGVIKNIGRLSWEIRREMKKLDMLITKTHKKIKMLSGKK